MTTTHQKSRGPRNAVLETLTAAYPVFRDGLPLAIGIHKAIRERQPEIDAAQLRAAMKIHTASTRYLKALSQGQGRFDLDGNAAGEVTAEQRQQATDGLRDRFRKGAERRKAEQLEAERQGKEAERQEKLAKLAEKFNAR